MNESIYDKYEAVIGLEVHIQLLTGSKAYSSDPAVYGGMPNTHISPITLGHPGTLPKVNKKVIEYAVKLGIACHSSIRRDNHYARKNYFYPDLPKGYQITQDTTPICNGGYILINNKKDKKEKQISLTRIHMEEDAGKSIHDQDPFFTLIDLNRAGVPLLEMVSEPVIKTADEAYQYLTEVRKLVRYLEICDGNMEEGSLRCDANISVMPRGSLQMGKKVEVKNMNSIRNVQRAISYEIKRQVDEIEAGKTVVQETRSFDAATGSTFSMRSKEMANDYRYFPEPDIPPVIVTEKYVEEVRAMMPPLPRDLHRKFTDEFHLSEYDAGVLTDTKEIALFFEEVAAHTHNYKAAANWVMGPVKSYLNENALEVKDLNISPASVSMLIKMMDDGIVSHSAAVQKIFPALLKNPGKSPEQIAGEENLLQDSNTASLIDYAQKAISMYPEKVAEYKAGKSGLTGLFMGEVMKLSKGKADPKLASRIVKELLDK